MPQQSTNKMEKHMKSAFEWLMMLAAQQLNKMYYTWGKNIVNKVKWKYWLIWRCAVMSYSVGKVPLPLLPLPLCHYTTMVNWLCGRNWYLASQQPNYASHIFPTICMRTSYAHSVADFFFSSCSILPLELLCVRFKFCVFIPFIRTKIAEHELFWSGTIKWGQANQWTSKRKNRTKQT